MIGLLFTGAAVFTGCSKEVKIEKNLWKNGGEWNVKSYSYTSVSSSGTNNINISVNDMGTMTFAKDGSGTYSFTQFGSTDTGTLKYTNTADELALTIDNSTTTFNMTWEKDNITLINASTSTSNGETITETETYKITKK